MSRHDISLFLEVFFFGDGSGGEGFGLTFLGSQETVGNFIRNHWKIRQSYWKSFGNHLEIIENFDYYPRFLMKNRSKLTIQFFSF
jgi:hypothetical protein